MHPPNLWSDLGDFATDVAEIATGASNVAHTVQSTFNGQAAPPAPAPATPASVAAPAAAKDNSMLVLAGAIALALL